MRQQAHCMPYKTTMATALQLTRKFAAPFVASTNDLHNRSMPPSLVKHKARMAHDIYSVLLAHGIGALHPFTSKDRQGIDCR